MFNYNHNLPCEDFIAQFAELFPRDYKALRYINEDDTGLDNLADKWSRRHWRKICFYAEIQGLFPQFVIAADGVLYPFAGKPLYYWECNKQYAWAESVAEPIESDDLTELKGELILVPYETLSSKDKELLLSTGAILVNLTDLITAKLAETTQWFTYENVINYLTNLKARYIEEERGWSVIIGRYTEVIVKYQNNHWLIDDGSGQESEVRKYLCLNYISCHNEHLNVVIALFYILSGMREQEVKGRKAFSPFLFVDEVHVGFTHDILETARRHKVGVVDFGLKGDNFLPVMGKGGSLVTAAAMYESMEWSVFMHKGAQYIIVHAECVGFSRVNGSTCVAWYADKEAKLTGRNLFTVATAAEWIDD